MEETFDDWDYDEKLNEWIENGNQYADEDKVEQIGTIVNQLHSLGTEIENEESLLDDFNTQQSEDKKETIDEKREKLKTKTRVISTAITQLQTKALFVLEKDMDKQQKEKETFDENQPHPAEIVLNELKLLKQMIQTQGRNSIPPNIVEFLNVIASVRQSINATTQNILTSSSHPRKEMVLDLSKNCSERTRDLIILARKFAGNRTIESEENLLREINELGATCYLLLNVIFGDEDGKGSPSKKIRNNEPTENNQKVKSTWLDKKTWGNTDRISQKFGVTETNNTPGIASASKGDSPAVNKNIQALLDSCASTRKLGLTIEASTLLFDSIYNFRDLGEMGILD